MKTFGQFLIEKELISKELLLDCILEQISSLPATSQLVKDKKMMSSHQILQVVEVQSRDEIGFKEACISLGFWSDELNSQIKKELLTIRTPIGNILLKKGLINLSELTKAVDEFLSDDKNLSPMD
jgi:hypothetical protein